MKMVNVYPNEEAQKEIREWLEEEEERLSGQ